ncbi:MAG: transporter permease [Naasia sp.]|uniref:ABC transporter permease n=1 Tax=Naasia sp. TaxID=2546198 RepID=UPI00262BB1DF|nr:ABC transporter permease [Naasia sp.]MCU1571486.1 transporter permease [Naasia sp.]
MSPFAAALRAEFTKTFTTRIWWILLLVMFGYLALLAGGISFGLAGLNSARPELAQQGGEGSVAGLPLALVAPVVYSLATAVGYVFPVLLGSLAVTNEFRHKTLTPTFLATPKRGASLAAKWGTMLVLGALYGVVALIGTVGVGALGFAVFGLDSQLGDGDIQALLARAVLAMALWAVVGVGLGVLVPSQVGSIVLILAFTQFVEPILRLAGGFADWAGEVARFLPGAASDSLVGASIYSVISGSGVAALEWWQGGLVLAAYAIALAALGYAVSWRRDVT